MQYKNLKIEWLGHAGFLIKNNRVIYIDPFHINTEEKADIILITHPHYDHCSLEDIQKIVRDKTVIIITPSCQSKINKLSQDIDVHILSPGEVTSLNGIKIFAMPSYNIDKEFHPKDEGWNSYVLDVRGVKIYHAGDTDLIPEMSHLGDIDIALLPVGGRFTMTAEEAARAASIIKPGIAIPMHYGSIVGKKEDAGNFASLCQEKGIKAEILEKS